MGEGTNDEENKLEGIPLKEDKAHDTRTGKGNKLSFTD